MFIKTFFLMYLSFFIMGCGAKPYTYHSVIEETKVASFFSTLKDKKHLYQMKTIVTSPYFFSIQSAKELLAKKMITNIISLAKKKNKRYFALIEPKELSNIDGSLVNSLSEFIERVEVRSVNKEMKDNRAFLQLKFILLEKRAVEYVVWDTQSF